MNIEKCIQLNDHIRLVVTDPPLEQTMSEAPLVVPLDSDTLLKKLSIDEFFEALDGASSEQLQMFVAGFEKKPISANQLPGLFEVSKDPRNLHEIFAWWEYRRLAFNVIVGAIGMLFLLAIAFEPIFIGAFGGTVFYATFANICYSLGAPSEYFISRCTLACFRKAYPSVGPLLLKLTIGIFSLITVLGGLLLFMFRGGGI